MIVIDKSKLKFLLAGRTINVTTSRDYRKGHDYAVGLRPNKTVCRAIVLKITPTDDGWMLDIRHAVHQKPLLLARDPGAQRSDYVREPSKALQGEGEVLDAETLERYGLAARARHSLRETAVLRVRYDEIGIELDSDRLTRLQVAKLRRQQDRIGSKMMSVGGV